MFIYLDTEQTYQLGEKGLNDGLNRRGVSVTLDEEVAWTYLGYEI